MTFTLNETKYTVIPLTDEVFEEIEAITDIEGIGPVAALKQQLALLTDTDPEAFADADLRQLRATVNAIMDNVMDPTKRGSRGKRQRG